MASFEIGLEEELLVGREEERAPAVVLDGEALDEELAVDLADLLEVALGQCQIRVRAKLSTAMVSD